MAGNSILNKSKSTRDNDEFFTTYETIEDEICHYTGKFKGKIVLCNCDDPFESNFSKYFMKNFNKLGLKKLICTSYHSSRLLSNNGRLLDENGEPLKPGNGYLLEISKVPKHINNTSSDEEIENLLLVPGHIKKLKSDGDFRSDECVNYLKKADIICTNPPFSLFREWMSLVCKYEKQFLVIGNSNAITYKEIFPLIQENKVWLGYHYGDMSFRVPEDSEPKTNRYWVDETGQKWRSLGNAMWLTNIDIERRHKLLPLSKIYREDEYPKFDEYDAIEVSRVANIPMDYDGTMAVPITFLNKHSPRQFRIIGEANHGSDNSFDLFKPTIDGKLIYKRILIQRIS